jgi:branched-chain amino acid transport system permease protein
MSSYLLSIASLVGINIIFALGLNLISGLCGQVSLGHAAFYGVGAYTTALLAKAGYPIWATLPAAMLAAALAGLLVGLCSLRVREDFLAIATMGAGFVFLGIVKQNDALGGEIGISGVSAPGLSRDGLVILEMIAMLLVILFSVHIRRSWLGFGFSAVADDDVAAQMIGVDNRSYKLTAFCIGTALAGLAGGFLAYYLRSVSPDSFGFSTSISVLCMVVLGGMQSIVGCIVATTLLTIMPETLRFAENYKLLIFGVLLFVTMRFLPDGLGGALQLVRHRKVARP